MRFIKKHEWTIATTAITLLAAIYAVIHGEREALGSREKIIIGILIALVAVFASFILAGLHAHLKRVRVDYDEKDPDPWFRGISIVGILIGAVIVSGVFVLYFLALSK